MKQKNKGLLLPGFDADIIVLDKNLNLATNEYAVITHKDKIGDIIKWNGETYSTLNYKPISSDYFGKINPRNIQQRRCSLLSSRTSCYLRVY